MKMSIEDRFMRHVRKEGGCWLWTGALHPAGYGWFSVTAGRPTVAHGWAFRRWRGEVPADKQLDHLCRVRACVNPQHLEVVTSRENTLRGVGPAAVNARKTACRLGHPFDARNTYTEKTGKRRCRVCARDRQRDKRGAFGVEVTIE